MKKSELKDLVKTYFNLQEITVPETQTFASIELVGGMVVTNKTEEDFVVGDQLFIVSEDGTEQTAPAGEVEWKEGIFLVIDEQGIILEIKMPEELPVEEEVEAATEPIVETPEEVTPVELSSEKLEDEKFAEMVANLISPKLESLALKLTELEAKVEKFAKAPAGKPIVTEMFNKKEVKNTTVVLSPRKQARYDELLNSNKK